MENQTAGNRDSRQFGEFFSRWRIRPVIGATALMVLVTGIWIAVKSGEAVGREMHQKLIRQATDIANGMNAATVQTLSFTAADKDMPLFRRMCEQFQLYAKASGIPSIHTLALRDGQIVFGPGGLPDGYANIPPPGTVYQKPTEKDFDLFQTGQPQVQEPVRDEYGTFVRALAPITDAYTEEVVAEVCLEVEVSVWKAAVRQAQWIPVGVTVALLFFLLLCDLTLEHLYRNPERRDKRTKHIEAILCAGFMVSVTLALAVHFYQANREARRNTFDSLAHARAAACVEKMYDLRGMLDELRYYFESSPYISRKEFGLFCNAMAGKSLVEMFFWVPAVPSGEAGSFVDEVRNEGVPDYSLWQKNQAGVNEPVAPRPVYYPALYVEPLLTKRVALGYDLNSEPRRSVAIREALNTGLAAASDPVQFITATNSPPGLLVFLPVNGPVQKGLVAIAARPENLLGLSTQTKKKSDMNICLFRLEKGTEPLFIAGSSDQCGLPCWDDKDDIRITIPAFRFGKAYAFRVVPSPGWLAAHPLTDGWLTFGVGLLLTLLTSSLTTIVVSRQAVLEKRVEDRTAELKRAEKNLVRTNRQNELILSSTVEGILGLNSRGVHTFINPAAAKMLGYEVEELIGRPSHSIWHHTKPDGTRYPREECPILIACREGTGCHVTDDIFWRKNGTGFSVEYNSVPIYEYGLPAGAVVTFTDNTERRNREEEIKKALGLLEVTLEATADGVLLVDDTGKILCYNKKFIEMWKIPENVIASGSDEATQKFVLGQLSEPEKFLAKVQELYRHPEEKSFDVLRFRDGRVFERHSQSQRISGGLSGRVWSFHDATKREQAEALLWASQTQLDLALQSAEMGVWQWDVISNKRTYDRQTCALLGLDPTKFTGTEEDFLAVVHPADRKKIKKAQAQTVERHDLYDIEFRVVRPDGTIRHIASRAHLFLDDGDRQLKVTGVCWDITDRKKAEAELQDTKAILQAAMDHSPVGIAIADALSGKMRYVNDAAITIRGGTREEIANGIGLDQYIASRKLFDLDGTPLSPDDIPLVRAIKYGETTYRESIIRRADNDDRIVIANAAPITNLQGEITAAIVIFLDITDRRKAEDRMRLLAKHLQVVREEERKRISRELHDDIGQILTAIKIDLTGVEVGSPGNADAKEKLGGIHRLLLDGIKSVHSLCRQLRPGALDDLSLSDALEGLVDDWTQRNKVECALCADVDDEALSDDVKTAVFRMTQEALTNVSRYAQASKVEIDLVADEKVLHVSISDNGCGMEFGAAEKPTSFGLLGMRERVVTLGGTLSIESAPGKGTRIEATIPLPRNG